MKKRHFLDCAIAEVDLTVFDLLLNYVKLVSVFYTPGKAIHEMAEVIQLLGY